MAGGILLFMPDSSTKRAASLACKLDMPKMLMVVNKIPLNEYPDYPVPKGLKAIAAELQG